MNEVVDDALIRWCRTEPAGKGGSQRQLTFRLLEFPWKAITEPRP